MVGLSFRLSCVCVLGIWGGLRGDPRGVGAGRDAAAWDPTATRGSEQGLSWALVAKVKMIKEYWRQHPKSELYQRIIQIKDLQSGGNLGCLSPIPN